MTHRWLPMLSVLLLLAAPAPADERAAAAALADVLFELEIENLAYRVGADGAVAVAVGRSVPERLYAELVARLQSHPDIAAVRAERAEHDFEAIR